MMGVVRDVSQHKTVDDSVEPKSLENPCPGVVAGSAIQRIRLALCHVRYDRIIADCAGS